MKEVLDTRFLRELFYSNHVETKEKIRRKMQSLEGKCEGILPTIVIAEITQINYTLFGKDVAESRYQDLVQSGLEVQNLTSIIAEQAGIFRGKYRNLPMGDCIIAATALLSHARVLSDDRHFDIIDEVKRIWI